MLTLGVDNTESGLLQRERKYPSELTDYKALATLTNSDIKEKLSSAAYRTMRKKLTGLLASVRGGGSGAGRLR